MANENENEIGYELKIVQQGGNEIYIDTKSIMSVKFIVDTVDDNVKDRSENVLNRVIITGAITNENKDATKNLLLWSLATKDEEVYRSAEVTIRFNETKRIRKYSMDKVFCLDYSETFENGSKDSTFELKFSQRKDDLKNITVLA